MEHNPSWEASSRPATQEISQCFNTSFHYRVFCCLLEDRVLNHILPLYLI
jgi:hypothetical protein